MNEAEYKEILDKQDKGELTIYIDTSWFRQFYTTAQSSKLESLVKYPRANQIQRVKLIMYLEGAILLGTIIISVVSFKLFSLFLAPVIFIVWMIIKANASKGRQELHLVLSIIILLFTFIAAILFQISWAIGLFLMSASVLFFLTYFLYFYTAYITFDAIHKSFEFYSCCTKLNKNAIWTRPNKPK